MPVPEAGASFTRINTDARAGHFRLLYAFEKSPDGENPNGALTQLNGALYGLAYAGGQNGYGAIYSVSVTGKEKVIHSFDRSDGYSPSGSLLAGNGVLYGTVQSGYGFYGDVYSVTPSGKFNILHKFSGEDGITPDAGLVEVGGALYGTTYQGGTHSVGTVYAVGTSGGEIVVHSFGSYSTDGTYPHCLLTFYQGKLFGTTAGGGTYNDGTVFSLTTSGQEKVLYSFGSGSDGKDPGSSSVAPLGGALYGTTYEGGTHNVGVVFKVLPSGAERTLYNFGEKKADGTYPQGGMIAYRNALYGTTTIGGANNQGTIFRITPNGKETVLYSFSGDDGTDSNARLLLEGTNMYGTLFGGGENDEGTVFRFTPK
ncbi:MAG TPA: choice-of-anchor tandem repeat GloVer-containing protein [Candidatus Tumulicola sp.]